MEKSPTPTKEAGECTLSAGFVSELPETPGLKLLAGKISTATRKTLLPPTAKAGRLQE